MKKVLDEMTRKVMFALETDYLDDVWVTMNALGVRHVPVTRDRKVIGILSDRDILRFSREAKNGEFKVPRRPVGEVMITEVVTCRSFDSIGEVAGIFLKKKIDALPVVYENGELQGIITSTDLLRLLCQNPKELLQELPFLWEPESLIKDSWRPGVA